MLLYDGKVVDSTAWPDINLTRLILYAGNQFHVQFVNTSKLDVSFWNHQYHVHFTSQIKAHDYDLIKKAIKQAWVKANPGIVVIEKQDLVQLERERKGNVLFNDALNTFYLVLYGVRHMVKDHLDSEKGNPLPPHGLLFSIDSKGSFICTIPQTG